MLKKIAAVVGGVFIGLIIAFARVGAFPFWGSDSNAPKAPPAQQAQAAPAEPLPAPPVPGIHVAPPAQPNTPEPNEKAGVITSFAPLVKRMIPAVAVVKEAGAACHLAAAIRSTSCAATSARAVNANTSSTGWDRV